MKRFYSHVRVVCMVLGYGLNGVLSVPSEVEYAVVL